MLVELICPKCGGKMEVDASREKCFCTFCGAEVVNMAQKIDINQNVNVSGTVTTKMDRSNEPNLIVDFSSGDPNARMFITFDNTKIKRVINNGQTVEMRLPLGHTTATMDLAGRSYKRDLWIVAEAPVRVNASAFGSREIVIDQPPYQVSEQDEAEIAIKEEEAKRRAQSRPSGLSIAAFVLSLTFYGSIVGLILGIVSLAKDRNRKKVFALLGTIIGGVMTLIFFIYLIALIASASAAVSEAINEAIQL